MGLYLRLHDMRPMSFVSNGILEIPVLWPTLHWTANNPLGDRVPAWGGERKKEKTMAKEDE